MPFSYELLLVTRVISTSSDSREEGSSVGSSAGSVMTIASFETEALLDKPVSIDFDDTLIKNVLNNPYV